MRDEEILDLYFARNEQAISETKTKYGKYLRFIVQQALHDPSDAEECENDVYLDAWNSIPPHRPTPFKTYLAALARRRALDRIDARNAERRGSGAFAESLEELEECLPAQQDDPAHTLVLQDTVARFLKKLPRRQRAMFLQRYWYARSISEIAKEFGMGESAVKMSLKRAREVLRNYLKN